MVDSEADEIIEELRETLLQRYQERPEESMKRSEFIFNIVDVLHYNLNKFKYRRVIYIYSPEQLKNKKATINPKNNDNKCFQYTLAAALIYQSIKKDPQRILKTRPFIDHYN